MHRAGRKISLYLWVAAAVLFTALVVFALIRVQAWQSQADVRRLLTLVNPWNPTSETGYSFRSVDIGDGILADRACSEALKRMLEDCRASGGQPKVLAGYRSLDDQLVLYDGAVQDRVDEGLSPEEAENEVAALIAPVGRSEHELGLAFDIVDEDDPTLNPLQAETQTSRWLSENAWKYGFILRYPQDAEEITGYNWHPWHYRYVGLDAAENIYSLGITLEEYLSLFYSEEAQVVYESAG